MYITMFHAHQNVCFTGYFSESGKTAIFSLGSDQISWPFISTVKGLPSITAKLLNVYSLYLESGNNELDGIQ